MRVSLDRLEAFWRAADSRRPLVILGAGRWGRTLACVATAARSTANGVALVARSNYDDTRAWKAADARLAAVAVHDTLDAALRELRTSAGDVAAIVASRPSAHLADAAECFAAGLPTLVENPLAPTAVDSARILALAERQRAKVALAVEFSLLPAFHHAAGLLRSPVTSTEIEWEDPADEVRHGQRKRSHPEIDALGSVVPHAVSIWRVFVSEADRWRVRSAAVGARGDSGKVEFEAPGCRMVVDANRAGTSRRRRLHLSSADGHVEVDFATRTPQIVADGAALPLPPDVARLDSALRLEIGAFLGAVAGQCDTPLTAGLGDFVRIQAEVHAALAAARR